MTANVGAKKVTAVIQTLPGDDQSTTFRSEEDAVKQRLLQKSET